MIKLLSTKLHRVRVTSTNKDYMGSVSIDSELMAAVGMIPLEEVEIVNLTNGNRYTTYVIPAESGSGIVGPNGGGAFLCKKGDLLIIFSYVYKDKDEVSEHGHEAKIAFIKDERNEIKEVFLQRVVPDGDKMGFESNQLMNI